MSPVKRLTGLFYQSANLKQAVGILFVTVFISSILGLVRNIVIANRVGVSFGSIGPLDSYYAAFILPDLLYSIVIVGALSSAILPLLVQIDTEGDKAKFWKTFNILLSTGFTAIVVGLIFLYFLLPSLIPLIYPGFSAADQEFTLSLSRILLLSPLFFTVSQLSTSALQAKKYFFAPALAPLVYNLSIIAAALLIPDFGLSVLVFGVIFGAAAHFLVQLPMLIRLGWRFNFETGFGNETVRRVVKLMIPRTVALTATQLTLLVFYRIASHLQEGSIAIYRLTDDLQTAPVLLLANTLAMAILPDFARHIARDNKLGFEELIGKAMRLLLFIFLPVTVFLLIFRYPIISLYISLGQSIASSETVAAVDTFTAFVVSLFFQGAVLLLVRAYFARSDTVRPTIFSLISAGCALLVAGLLSSRGDFGVSGLAVAFSVGAFVNAALLWSNLGLNNRVLLRDFQGRSNLLPIAVGTLCTALVFTISYQLGPMLGQSLGAGQSITHLITILTGAATGAVFYWAWSRAFRLEQWQMICSRRPREDGGSGA
jgi:putative peptidoglycan lipid II flippase